MHSPAMVVAMSARGVLNLGTVVIDGVGSPKEQETDLPSAYYCVYPLIR